MEEQTDILVVDDEGVMRSLICDVLSDIGYRIEAASSGREAIEKIKRIEFSIVITDLKMPEVDGFELLKRIKAINSDICVIIITAYSSIESAIEAMREGAYDCIIKPFNIEELKLVFQRAMERQYLLYEAKKKEFYRELSILDSLTGLYNHRHFYEVLPREVERAKRYKHCICFLVIDIDNFKVYNDTNGHLAGDRLLQVLSKVLINSIGAADMAFRYGGEEFVIICPETPKEGGRKIAERLLNLIRKETSLTVSIGIASYPDDSQSKDELIMKADSALYKAKHLGKNRFCVFEDEG